MGNRKLLDKIIIAIDVDTISIDELMELPVLIKREVKDPFKPELPQRGRYFINALKDKTMQHKFADALDLHGYRSAEYLYQSILGLLLFGFDWKTTPEGAKFWAAITRHFSNPNGGRKTYNDFKHLDKSAKK